MDRQENQSEIARLRQRIAEEYEAAMRGLSGFASGSARHLVGEQEATRLMAETLETL
jgi:hypothetical protein